MWLQAANDVHKIPYGKCIKVMRQSLAKQSYRTNYGVIGRSLVAFYDGATIGRFFICWVGLLLVSGYEQLSIGSLPLRVFVF